MFDYKSIRLVHVELTTRCNARCPMCKRNYKGRIRPGLQLIELTRRDIETIFSEPLLRMLRQIDLCGVFGDPVVTSEFAEIVDYFSQVNPAIHVEVYTNGSVRPKEWWRELAKRRTNVKMIFAIDGLVDTHALYRVNTNFETVLANAQAFIEGGGRAQWDYIVFRHNEHQVEDARALAARMGFSSFNVKATARFHRYLFENPAIWGAKDAPEFPVYDRQGNLIRYLEMPVTSRYQNRSTLNMLAYVSDGGNLTEYFETTPISCHVIANQSIFVSAEGTVFPCCWTYDASKYSEWHESRADDLQVARLLKDCGGSTAINAKHRSIEEIVNGQFFNMIADSWDDHGYSCGRLKVCARFCGANFKMFYDQFESTGGIPGQVS